MKSIIKTRPVPLMTRPQTALKDSGERTTFPSSEYIEREALYRKVAELEMLARDRYLDTPTNSPVYPRYMAQLGERTQLKFLIADFPAADVVEVKHGSWLGEGDGYADGELVYDVWYCSECNHCIDDGTDDPDLLPNYCPNCGAKMDGERQ